MKNIINTLGFILISFFLCSCSKYGETKIINDKTTIGTEEINEENKNLFFDYNDVEVDEKHILEQNGKVVMGNFNHNLDKIKIEIEVDEKSEYYLWFNLSSTGTLASGFDIYTNNEYATSVTFTHNSNDDEYRYYKANLPVTLEEGYNKIILINFTNNIFIKDFWLEKIDINSYEVEKIEGDEYVNYLEKTSFEMIQDMKKGWNLGNTLDAISSGEGQKGLETEIAWGNPYTTKEMIDKIKEAGFDTLRVPTTWYQHIDENGVIDKEYMVRVREVVNYGIDNGMFVILNTHHEEWLFPTEENFENNANMLIKLWEQISEEFKDYDGKLIFEVMNEPRLHGTPLEWIGGDEKSRDIINRLNEVAYKTIRENGGNNEKRHIMLPTYAANSGDAAMKDYIVIDDSNIIVSVHNYAPYDFALNVDGENTWGHQHQMDDVDDFFKRLNDYYISKGIAVIIGESGAMNKENLRDRIEWAKYFYGKSEEVGIPALWWDNGLIDSGETFGLLDREKLEFTYPELVNAILNK